jgi:hypothetical protein
MAENPLVVECPFNIMQQGQFPLRGKWHKEFFHNENPIILELGCGRGEYTVGLGEKNALIPPRERITSPFLGLLMSSVAPVNAVVSLEPLT